MVVVYCAEMTGQPRANREDRTSLVISAGMVALFIVGVASVFGNTIAAAFVPPAAPAPETMPAAADLAAAATAPPTGTSVDGGGSKS